MTSARSQSEIPEFGLRPGPGLAALIGVLALIAVAGVLISGLGAPLKLALSLSALVLAGHAVVDLIRPRLALRFIDGRLEYRSRGHASWSSIGARGGSFVSPWYIAWRGRGWRAHGVFRGQVDAGTFRKVAVFLRHHGSC